MVLNGLENRDSVVNRVVGSIPSPSAKMDEDECYQPVLMKVKEQSLTEVLEQLPKDGKLFYLIKGIDDPGSRDYLEEVAEMLGFEVVALQIKI